MKKKRILPMPLMVDDFNIPFSSVSRNLGVLLDSHLTMDAHITYAKKPTIISEESPESRKFSRVRQ